LPWSSRNSITSKNKAILVLLYITTNKLLEIFTKKYPI